MIDVKDYELLNNLDLLFEYPLIIYGAGEQGKRIEEFLRNLNVKIKCFCDGSKEKKEYLGYNVVNIEDLGEALAQIKYSVIVASDLYFEEMIGELDVRQYTIGHVFTYFGVECSIYAHSGDERIDCEYLRLAKEEKRTEIFTLHALNTAITQLKRIMLDYPKILVYQPGKVASTTMYKTLINYGFNCMHLHNFFIKDNIDEIQRIISICMKKIEARGIKIVSLVREPISRSASAYLENIMRKIVDAEKDINEAIVNQILWDSIENVEFTWFDSQIKKLTGIDIYERPFNREKGYTIIREGNIEILILKMEKLNDNVQILGDFIGQQNVTLSMDNIGKEKISKYIYSKILKNLVIPQEVINNYYVCNEKVDHFYSEEEKELFIKKWEK